MAYQPTEWEHGDIITGGKLNKIEEELTHVSDNAIYGFGGAQLSSDGLTPFSYINAGDPMPSNPKKGDTVFIKDGNDFTIYSYDGEQWNIKVDPNLSQRLSDTLKEAKDSTDKAIADNNDQINNTVNEVAQEKVDLAIKDADFNNKAQAMADKALSDAKANTAQMAQETLNSANQHLADAKTDLTKSIASEASARNEAVAHVNAQAQTYANQARADALNTIAKEVTDRQNAVSALDTKATNAVNQAKSDITDTINAISAGDRNYILDTANPKTQMSNGNDNQDLYDKANFYKSLDQWAKTDTQYKISFDWNLKTVLTNDMMLTLIINQAPWQNFTVTIPANKLSGHVDITFILWSSMISAKPNGITFRINSQMSSGNTITYSNLFMKSGNVATDWTPAPEDAVLDYTTKDNKIKETITQYKETNNGYVSKLQTDVTTALGQVATKVSQTDYDKKTGDLTTKYTQVKQTTDSQATDIVDIKKTATSQASKINSISSDVDGTKQSIGDIKKTQESQSDKVNQITNDVNGTKQSITDIQTKDGKQDTRMGTIETSVSGVKSDFSTYKTDANGRIGTAQTTAQTAVDGLKNKVSQTDYNAKTGQLQTDLTTTTQTANQAKTDIVSIKKTDTSQDSRMNTIESDASGTKQTVSQLQTVQGQQSGSISTLQQRADGFDATVTKVDNLAVGGRNLYLNSRVLADSIGGNGPVKATVEPFDSTTNMWHIVAAQGSGSYNGIYLFNYGVGRIPDNSDWSYSADIKGTGKVAVFGIEESDKNPIKGAIGSEWSRISQTGHLGEPTWKTIIMYFDATDSPLDVYIKLPKLETGTIPTDWTPAPEELSGATAKAQLTADQANTSLNAYKNDADGRITKAQSDIVQTAKDVTTKVSQTDYNAKTGDLSTKVSTAQQTADNAVTTIGNYKTSNDNRVKATESKITTNAEAITQKVSQTDYNQKTGELSGKISEITQTAGKISQTVSDVKSQVDGLIMGGRNLVLGTATDTAWTVDSASNNWSFNVIKTGLKPGQTYTFSAEVTLGNTDQKITTVSLYNEPIGQWLAATEHFKADGTRDYWTFTVPTTVNTPTASLIIYAGTPGSTGGKSATYHHIKVETGNLPTDWTPAPEDVDNKISTVSQTVRDITSIVSDPKTGLSTRVQTAEGILSTVKSTADGAMSKASQTANDISKEISDRKTGDSNTLQSSKDFTTSNITSAVNGVNSTITQTSDSLIAKINTKTDQQTVLSLFKDNWSIGITDNIGKITSGIVGNASQMSLISKNVTIDSPSTQITGTAWINSAMIQNGAIGSAQIGDATITSAKIAQLDVAKLTGNVSNFIQSNWNGLYQSVKISPIGMTITTKQGSTAKFNQDGLVLDGALGTTNVLNGKIELISSTNEYLGTFQHETMPEHDNVDYLMIKLAGWHTSKPGDSDYDLNSDRTNTIRGGDGIGFGVTNSVGTYDMKMSWDSSLVAGYKGRKVGWHVEDIMTWHQAGFFENGLTISQNIGGSDKGSLHVQGATLPNKHKWYGFFNVDNHAGFGIDDTNDVWFYVGGKSYSLYDMLGRLGMR